MQDLWLLSSSVCPRSGALNCDPFLYFCTSNAFSSLVCHLMLLLSQLSLGRKFQPMIMMFLVERS